MTTIKPVETRTTLHLKPVQVSNTVKVKHIDHVVIDDLPIYEGVVEVTPGDEAITLSTKDKKVCADITVSAVPSNYGKISWDGFKLTVS